MNKILATLGTAFVLVLGSSIPANAGLDTPDVATSAQWFDIQLTEDTVLVSNGVTNYAKVVTAVQAFTSDGSFLAQSVTALRVRCSVRNLNGSIISGVKVSECALGYTGGATITNNTTDALDGGTCCANSYAPFRYAHYDVDGQSFRGRGTYCWRFVSNGQLVCSNFLSGGTNYSFLLGL